MPARTCMRIQHATAHAECEPLLHTSARGPRDPTPRTRQAGPPTTLAPATRTNARSGLQFPLHPRRGSCPTGTTGPAGPSAAGPHLSMVGNHGDIFLPPDPVGPGRRSGVYPPVLLGHPVGPPEATGASSSRTTRFVPQINNKIQSMNRTDRLIACSNRIIGGVLERHSLAFKCI